MRIFNVSAKCVTIVKRTCMSSAKYAFALPKCAFDCRRNLPLYPLNSLPHRPWNPHLGKRFLNTNSAPILSLLKKKTQRNTSEIVNQKELESVQSDMAPALYDAEEFKKYIQKLPLLQYPDHYKVLCIKTPEDTDLSLIGFLSEKNPVFGVDMEWRPNFKKGGKENKTALIQICGANKILLLQVSQMSHLPQRLVEFLENPDILKAGVNIRMDGLKLQRDFGVTVKGLINLEAMCKICETPKLQLSNMRSLRALTAMLLEKNMPKGRVRLSNWAIPDLTSHQIKYAANDAYASYELYQSLAKIRQDTGLPAHDSTVVYNCPHISTGASEQASTKTTTRSYIKNNPTLSRIEGNLRMPTSTSVVIGKVTKETVITESS